MTRTGIRFRPPQIAIPAEVDWVLARVFGAPSDVSEPSNEIDPQKATEVAGRIGLRARIRARNPRLQLGGELGEKAFAVFDLDFHQAVATSLQQEAVLRQIAVTASELQIRPVALKGVALRLMGIVSDGSRPSGDIDLLVPRDRAQALWDALVGSGCRPSKISPPTYHLELLSHPLGSAVEVHTELPGVQLKGVSNATVDQCLEADLLLSAPDPFGEYLVPSRGLLAAHLLAHGLGQHGKSPELYPAFQLLADLQDLGFSPTGGRDLPVEVFNWVDRGVSPQEVSATVGLLGELESGRQASAILQSRGAHTTVLDHFLAGVLSHDYLYELKLSRQLGSGGPRRRLREIFWNSWRAVWLTNVQIRILYGEPKSALGYLGWRLWRPFELIGRTVRAVWGALKLRIRRRIAIR